MDYVSRGTFWSVKMHFDWNGASINGCMICGLDYQGYIFCIRWSGIIRSGAIEASSMWLISYLLQETPYTKWIFSVTEIFGNRL